MEAVTTTDHEEIRAWVEARGGRPSRVADSRTGPGGSGILRIDFGAGDAGLEPIEWEEFFRIFDERKLSFLHQDETSDGKVSRFNRFIEPDRRPG